MTITYLTKFTVKQQITSRIDLFHIGDDLKLIITLFKPSLKCFLALLQWANFKGILGPITKQKQIGRNLLKKSIIQKETNLIPQLLSPVTVPNLSDSLCWKRKTHSRYIYCTCGTLKGKSHF